MKLVLSKLCLAIAVAQCFTAWSAGLTFGGRAVEMQGFHTNGEKTLKSSDGKADIVCVWQIGGERAVVEPPIYRLFGFSMKMLWQGQGEYVISSPKCVFDQQGSEVHSDAAVRVDGGKNCMMSGVGYDIFWRDDDGDGRSVVLVIRNAVCLTFSHGFANGMGKVVKDSKEEAQKAE